MYLICACTQVDASVTGATFLTVLDSIAFELLPQGSTIATTDIGILLMAVLY